MEIIESLESRRLLSSTPFFQLTSKGTLIIHGTVEANEIEVFLVHGKASQGVGAIVGVPDHGLQRLSNIYRAKANAVKRIWIDAGGGNDSIGISQVTRPATVLGGAGDDNVDHDLSGPMIAYGGAGNDSIGRLPEISAFDLNLDNFDLLDNAFDDMKPAPLNTFNGGIGDDTLYGDINTQLNGGAATTRPICLSTRNSR